MGKKNRKKDPKAAPTTVVDERNKSWPTVLKLREQNNLAKADELTLTEQLGYSPGNMIHIPVRVKDLPSTLQKFIDPDHLEAPVVVQLYPIAVRVETKFGRKRKRHPDDNEDEGILMEPFPTLYWITHPKAKNLISNLEKDGRGVEYERRLEADPNVRKSMEQAHRDYASERWNKILTEEDREWLTKRNWHPYVDFDHGRGIAGSRNPSTVKCLHAHTAHFWSGNRNNMFGKWVENELCEEAACAGEEDGETKDPIAKSVKTPEE